MLVDYYYKKLLASLHSHFKSLLYALLSFVLFLAVFALLINAEQDKAEAKADIRAANYANLLKTHVDRDLNALLFISTGIASYLNAYHHELNQQKIQAILLDLHSRAKHVRNIGIAVGYRMTYVYPIKSNEKIIGVDFRTLPQQWPQVKQAIETQSGVLAGPLNLVQGGRGLIYRYPVFINGRYWGILSTVINTDSFLQAAFSNLNDKDYQFAIRVKGNDNAFYGDARLFNHPDVLISVSDVPNGKWEWAILRTTEPSASLIHLAQFMGGLISVLLATGVFFFLKERKNLTSQAMYDSLTGLANRRLLNDRMAQALIQAKRFKRTMAVMFIDIDYFKKINDSHGHDVGDELLKLVAIELSACIRDVDTLSRIGGDEFVIVLEEISQLEDVHMMAGKLMQRFSQPAVILGKPINVTLSIGIGITTGEQAQETLKSLMKKADIALYEAKAAGRNGYKVYTDS